MSGAGQGATPSPSGLSSVGRALGHALLVAAGWALFAWSWVDVTRRPNDVDDLWRLVIGAVVLLPVITLWWVLHNVGIYRRLGPRRGLRQVPLVYDHDFNGRPVRADWSALADAACVEIDLDPEGVKCYTAVTHQRPGTAAPPSTATALVVPA